MAQPVTTVRLSQFWIFDDFSEAELEQVVEFAKEAELPAGTILFRQGDVPERFYLLESGQVQEVGKEVVAPGAVQPQTGPGPQQNQPPSLGVSASQTGAGNLLSGTGMGNAGQPPPPGGARSQSAGQGASGGDVLRRRIEAGD